MKPSAKWRATFLFLKIWKKVLKREIFGNVENRFVTHSKHAISDCPKPNIVLFLSAAESDIFRYNTFFYNCLHTHIRFTLPACLRPERFLSLCKSSYLFSGLACVKLLTISRRELIRNAAYFIKYYTVSHFAIFSPPQSATQIEIRLTLLKHSCESSRRWKNVFGISIHVFFFWRSDVFAVPNTGFSLASCIFKCSIFIQNLHPQHKF